MQLCAQLEMGTTKRSPELILRALPSDSHRVRANTLPLPGSVTRTKPCSRRPSAHTHVSVKAQCFAQQLA